MLNVGYQSAGLLSIGPQDTAEPSSDEFNETIVPGSLTVAGQAITLGAVRDITPGELTVAGQEIGGLVIDNDARQLVTVTDISKIAFEITLFDCLTGVVPEVGDIWWVPTTSTDGGAFTLSGDGTFTVGVPTSGDDTLTNVAYYDTSEATWHGPADCTIVEAPTVLVVLPTTQPAFAGSLQYLHKTLVIEPGSLSVTGSSIDVATTVVPGELTIAGQDIVVVNNPGLAVSPGTITIAGRSIPLDTVLPVVQGSISVQGKDIDLFSGERIEVLPGTLTIAGQSIAKHRVYETLAAGTLTVAGSDIAINLGTGVAPVVSITGRFNTQADLTGTFGTSKALTGTWNK